MNKQLLVALLLLGSFAPTVYAQKTKEITPLTYKGRQIAVGSGGGFTGRSTTYYLFENGNLFVKRSTDTSFSLIGVQTKTNTNRVFSTLENTCNIKTTRFDQPGNTYRFVRWKKGTQEYRVVWGDSQLKPPANYPKFYDSFMAMLPKLPNSK